jgi:hypothetical protein
MTVPFASVSALFASCRRFSLGGARELKTGCLLRITNIKPVTDDEWQSEIVE